AAALPFYMVRAKNPLVPPRLFTKRNFLVINLSTLMIYGALYVFGYNLTLFLQGTIGWTAAAAGLSQLPGSLFLIFFSARFGQLAARYGPRFFLTLGPLILAAAVLYLAWIPSATQAWALAPGDPGSWLPPGSSFVDVLPATPPLGLGIPPSAPPVVP